MDTVLKTVGHRPYPVAPGTWIMRQRWNDLLFAHWPVDRASVQRLLPEGLECDEFDGNAWLGVVPFWMDRVQHRLPGGLLIRIPGVSEFSELNLRTYVRSRRTGKRGVYFFSLDATSPLAVAGARTIFRLPYYFASIQRGGSGREIHYCSRRLLVKRPVRLDVRYCGSGQALTLAQPGTLEYFLTERYCLFTTFAGKVLVGEIHHRQWPLEAAEAEFGTNELCMPHGLALPDRPPVLHFSRELEVYIWPLGFEQG